MSKAVDLTGKQFGELTVLSKDIEYSDKKVAEGKQRYIYWKCKCSCGKYVDVISKNLIKGNTQSCGHLRSQKIKEHNVINKKQDLVGKKFGKLTAIQQTDEKSSRGYYMWLCECECGNKNVLIPRNDLISGHSKSCGCGKLHIKDITNQRFGKLIAISRTDKSTSGEGYYWTCECDCGNIIEVPVSSLTSGETKSCGCISMSAGEERVEKILKDNNIPFEKQKTFDTCRSPINNYLLRFDFYVNNNFILEFDGQQHYFSTNNWWNTQEHLQKVKFYDTYKNQWCKNNNIKIKRIPYWELNNFTFEDIMSDKYLI